MAIDIYMCLHHTVNTNGTTIEIRNESLVMKQDKEYQNGLATCFYIIITLVLISRKKPVFAENVLQHKVLNLSSIVIIN